MSEQEAIDMLREAVASGLDAFGRWPYAAPEIIDGEIRALRRIFGEALEATVFVAASSTISTPEGE